MESEKAPVKKRLLRNTIASYAQFGGNFVLAFVQMKILTSFLTREEVGAFYGAAAYGLILSGLAQFGFPTVFARYFPKYEAQGEAHKIKGLFMIATFIYWAIALVEFPISLLIKDLIAVGPLKNVIIIAFLAYILFGYLTLIATAFTGLRKMHLTALFTLSTLITFNLGLFLFRKRLSVELALMTLMFSTLPFIIISFLTLRPFPAKTGGIIGEIRSYGTYSFLVSLLSPFFSYLDRFLVALFLPLGDAALFQIARRMELAVRQALAVPLNVLAPEFSYLWESRGGLVGKGKKGFELFARTYFVAGLLSFLLLVILGKPLILLTTTREYLASYPYLVFLLIGAIIACLYAPYTLLASSSGKMKLYFFSDLVFVLTYVSGVLLFVRPFRVWGFVLAWIIGHTITSLFVFKKVQKEVAERALSWHYVSAFLLVGVLTGIAGIKINVLWAIPGIIIVIALGIKILGLRNISRETSQDGD